MDSYLENYSKSGNKIYWEDCVTIKKRQWKLKRMVYQTHITKVNILKEIMTNNAIIVKHYKSSQREEDWKKDQGGEGWIMKAKKVGISNYFLQIYLFSHLLSNEPASYVNIWLHCD